MAARSASWTRAGRDWACSVIPAGGTGVWACSPHGANATPMATLIPATVDALATLASFPRPTPRPAPGCRIRVLYGPMPRPGTRHGFLACFGGANIPVPDTFSQASLRRRKPESFGFAKDRG